MARSAITSTMPETAEGRRNEANQPKVEVIPDESTKLLGQDSDDREWTIKYCSKRQRKVMTCMDSDGIVVHQEWVDSSKQMRIEKCEECTKKGLETEEQPPTYSSIFIA